MELKETIIQEGDTVFLILDERRRWLVEAKKDRQFHTHMGIIEFNDIIGKPYGSCIFSRPYEEQGYRFYVLKPLPSDYILHMGRSTQIIYPKDAGLILLYSGIGPGSKVIEIGSGSGALTCILGYYVKPNGHVYSYDIRKRSLKQAKKNVKKANLTDFITVKHGNVFEGDVQHNNMDAVVLDMPTPWETIEIIAEFLKLSGSVISFSPTIEQAKKTTFALEGNNFSEIKTVELLERTIQIKKNATRPNTRMVGHSGYLTFGRKTEQKDNIYRNLKPKEKVYVSLEGMPLRKNVED